MSNQCVCRFWDQSVQNWRSWNICKNRVLFDLFDVMWRKNVTSCVMGTATLLIDILTRNILKPTRSLYDFRFKVMAQIVVFVFSVTLTLTFDLFSIVCHTHCAWCTGISMRSFIRIRPVILGDMPWTHTHTHTHTHIHTHTHTHRRSF